MSEMNLEQKYANLIKRYNSLVDTVQDLNKTNAKISSDLVLSNQRNLNCQTALDNTKEIMRNALLDQNKIKEDYSLIIGELKAKIAVLEGR